MPIIKFLLEDMDVEAPKGATFFDVVEASGADVTFGCRNGTCGTCRIRIDPGIENVSPPNAEEKDFLHSIDAGPCQRLGCQISIHGDISVHYLGN